MAEEKAAAKQKVVVCGGGNAAHVFCCYAASNPQNEVHLVSFYATEAADFASALQHNENGEIHVKKTSEKAVVKGAPYSVSAEASTLKGADLVVLSLPAFAHFQYLASIKKHTHKKADGHRVLVGVFPGVSGIECAWRSLFGAQPAEHTLLACNTLPWACRTLKFGQEAEVLGTKHSVDVGIDACDEAEKARCVAAFQTLLGAQPKLADGGHLLGLSLGAVNALIHPAIMYGQWAQWDGQPMAEAPLFYQGVTQETATLLEEVSTECVQVGKQVKLETGADVRFPHIRDWYREAYAEDCKDASSTYAIVNTNPGYDGLTHKMKASEQGEGLLVPDWQYRYLSEDIPYGLAVIKGVLLTLQPENQCKVPVLDKLLQWGQQKLGKEYWRYNADGSVTPGEHIGESRAPQKFNITQIKQLI